MVLLLYKSQQAISKMFYTERVEICDKLLGSYFLSDNYLTSKTFIMVFPDTPKDDIFPPFAMYDGQDSFFGGEPALSLAVGYFVVLGFGAMFSIFTTLLVLADKYFGKNHEITSEHFK